MRGQLFHSEVDNGAGAVFNLQLGIDKERSKAQIQIDWIITDITIVPAITVNVFGKVVVEAPNSQILGTDDVIFNYNKSEFGSPTAVGTYSIIKEVWITQQIQAQVLDTVNVGGNTVNFYITH